MMKSYGENNNNISVGQKQRIAIARAILRNTPIILLDEATSALDYESKEKIEQTLKALAKTKTIIMITHQLDMLKESDAVIELENGKVIKKEVVNEK